MGFKLAISQLGQSGLQLSGTDSQVVMMNRTIRFDHRFTNVSDTMYSYNQNVENIFEKLVLCQINDVGKFGARKPTHTYSVKICAM